jgi:hypothetical protein
LQRNAENTTKTTIQKTKENKIRQQQFDVPQEILMRQSIYALLLWIVIVVVTFSFVIIFFLQNCTQNVIINYYDYAVNEAFSGRVQKR